MNPCKHCIHENVCGWDDVDRVVEWGCPTYEAKIDWISPENRLPEEYKEVLICDGIGWVTIGHRDDALPKGVFWVGNRNKKIKAMGWMPLPKPPNRKELKKDGDG